MVPSREKAMTACERCSAVICFEIEGPQLLRRDVGGEFDDLHRLAARVEHRIVGCLDPDLAATLGEALVLGALERTVPQALPETAIVLTLSHGRFDEQAVVTALDFRERVAHGREKVLVGVQNCAVERELNRGKGSAQSCKFCGLVVPSPESLEH